MQAAKHYHLSLKKSWYHIWRGTGKCFLPSEQQNGKGITMAAALLSAKPLFNHFHYTSPPQRYSFSPKGGNCIASCLQGTDAKVRNALQSALNPVKIQSCKISSTGLGWCCGGCGHSLWDWWQFLWLLVCLPVQITWFSFFFVQWLPLFSERHSRESAQK